MVQTKGIRDSLQRLSPSRTFEIETLHTLDGKDKSTALYDFGQKSLWTAELEEKLTSGQLDIVVHCLRGTKLYRPIFAQSQRPSDIPRSIPGSCGL